MTAPWPPAPDRSLTPADFAARMREIFPDRDGGGLYDEEGAHIEADKLLCQLLRSLGYGDGIAVFEAADKWYS